MQPSPFVDPLVNRSRFIDDSRVRLIFVLCFNRSDWTPVELFRLGSGVGALLCGSGWRTAEAGSSQHLGYMVRRDPDALLLKRGDHIAWANGLGQFAGRFADQVGFTRLIAGGPSILPGFDGIQWAGVGLEFQATRVERAALDAFTVGP
jgi:hypothetical protein